MALQYTLKGFNNTIAREGHVHSPFVLGTMPIFPIYNKNTATYHDRIKALRIAREEVTNIRTDQKVKRAIKHSIKSAAYFKINHGDMAFAYSEVRKQ